MTDAEDTTALRALIVPLLERHGLDLEELTVRTGAETHVDVIVDLPEHVPGSPDLDTVADASRELSELLDSPRSGLGDGPALLEVSTPGAERMLHEPRHFRRARGRLIHVVTADDRDLVARLTAVSDQDVLSLAPQPVRDAKGRIRGSRRGGDPFDLPIDDVVSAQVQIEFDPPAGTGPDPDRTSPNDAEER